MDFQHSEDRRMLADALGRYLQQRYDIETRHGIAGSEAGYSAEQWAALAELGIVAALVTESAGGLGGTGFDIAATFEQLGRSLVVEPFLGTLMATRALAQAGGGDELLEEIVAGAKIAAFAHYEPQGRFDMAEVAMVAKSADDGWQITGAKAVSPQIESADVIVVSARISGAPGDNEGIGLFLVDKDAGAVEVRGYPMIDGGRGGELTLDAAPAVLLAEQGLPLVEDAIAAGVVALSWEAVGIMDVLKDATLEYLRTRKQFGVAIGKFQALAHRMATVALEIEEARSSAINASAALEGARQHRERAVSAAKYTIDRVGRLVAEEAIQMHGGIGMTWELPLSHYAKRLLMIGHQLGDEDHHLARYIALGQAA